jgi:hypothetical protein
LEYSIKQVLAGIDDVAGMGVISRMRGEYEVLWNITMDKFRNAPGKNEASNRKRLSLLTLLYSTG